MDKGACPLDADNFPLNAESPPFIEDNFPLDEEAPSLIEDDFPSDEGDQSFDEDDLPLNEGDQPFDEDDLPNGRPASSNEFCIQHFKRFITSAAVNTLSLDCVSSKFVTNTTGKIVLFWANGNKAAFCSILSNNFGVSLTIDHLHSPTYRYFFSIDFVRFYVYAAFLSFGLKTPFY